MESAKDALILAQQRALHTNELLLAYARESLPQIREEADAIHVVQARRKDDSRHDNDAQLTFTRDYIRVRGSAVGRGVDGIRSSFDYVWSITDANLIVTHPSSVSPVFIVESDKPYRCILVDFPQKRCLISAENDDGFVTLQILFELHRSVEKPFWQLDPNHYERFAPREPHPLADEFMREFCAILERRVELWNKSLISQ